MSTTIDRFARKILRRRSSAQTATSQADVRRPSYPSIRERPSTSQTGQPNRSQSTITRPESPIVQTSDQSKIEITPKPRTYAQQQIAPALTVQAPSPPVRESNEPQIVAPIPSSRTQPLAPPTPESHPASPNSRPTNPGFSRLPTTPERPTGQPDTPPTLQEDPSSGVSAQDYFGPVVTQNPKRMGRRKVWIKRAAASPTLVQVSEDDLVDEIRDLVLRKYGNSLGRQFDSPDVSIKIVPREKSQQERVLSPEEPICNLLDAYFPGGQLVEEALLVEVPRKRTPLPSPRPHHLEHYEDNRPMENGTGYFPTMPAASSHPSSDTTRHSMQHPMPHSIGILETGQLPLIPPTPRERKAPHGRPKVYRQHTSSPTHGVLNQQAPSAVQHHNSRPKHVSRGSIQAPTSMPTPPALDAVPKPMSVTASTPPLDRVSSPRLKQRKRDKLSPNETGDERRASVQPQAPILSLIETTVPPINVLIVEDNPINMRLLEMFTKKLKVRWSTAINGRDAVTKWRAGGFHLVLMDIQLPIMSGLEATKEIRRLERVNGIGVFARDEDEEPAPIAKSGMNPLDGAQAENAQGDDKLSTEGIFKSPVIIVALTASSLQSDRHEALAAGCNDFLTKPVHFQWLERKVMEWGCMQALIDFDGWRKWKDMAAAADEAKQKEEDKDPEAKVKREKKEAKKAAMMARMAAKAS